MYIYIYIYVLFLSLHKIAPTNMDASSRGSVFQHLFTRQIHSIYNMQNYRSILIARTVAATAATVGPGDRAVPGGEAARTLSATTAVQCLSIAGAVGARALHEDHRRRRRGPRGCLQKVPGRAGQGSGGWIAWAYKLGRRRRRGRIPDKASTC